jgi:formate hydrogenlyase subunit 3/multisubunit Na+/H+ antiporter MnhD subunit
MQHPNRTVAVPRHILQQHADGLANSETIGIAGLMLGIISLIFAFILALLQIDIHRRVSQRYG